MVSQTGGKRLRTARALSLKRVAEMRCAIRRATAAGSSWCAAACCLEIQSTDRPAKGLQPPACDSKMTGTKRKPDSVQVLAVFLKSRLSCSYRAKTVSGWSAASRNKSDCIPEVTAKSKASPAPLAPRGSQTSAGRLPLDPFSVRLASGALAAILPFPALDVRGRSELLRRKGSAQRCV